MAHIYFYQPKCTHKKSYLIQHCCSRQPPTWADYRKLGNACCRKSHFCTGRNSFPTFTLLNCMFPSPLTLQAHNVFLVYFVLANKICFVVDGVSAFYRPDLFCLCCLVVFNIFGLQGQFPPPASSFY